MQVGLCMLQSWVTIPTTSSRNNIRTACARMLGLMVKTTVQYWPRDATEPIQGQLSPGRQVPGSTEMWPVRAVCTDQRLKPTRLAHTRLPSCASAADRTTGYAPAPAGPMAAHGPISSSSTCWRPRTCPLSRGCCHQASFAQVALPSCGNHHDDQARWVT